MMAYLLSNIGATPPGVWASRFLSKGLLEPNALGPLTASTNFDRAVSSTEYRQSHIDGLLKPCFHTLFAPRSATPSSLLFNAWFKYSSEIISRRSRRGRPAGDTPDPSRPALLPITPEHGDVVIAPAQPSFLAVFGAVLAESAFIHRPGSTVRDYIERAGPTRDADLEAAMVIRSDGSVVSNAAHRSWLNVGSGFISTSLFPGDTVFIPELLDKRSPYTIFIQGAKDWTQLFSQFGLGAAAIRTLRN